MEEKEYSGYSIEKLNCKEIARGRGGYTFSEAKAALKKIVAEWGSGYAIIDEDGNIYEQL